MTGTVAD